MVTNEEDGVSTASTTEPVLLENMEGRFAESLLRNNKQIRRDRAVAIVEDVLIKYRRTVEDLENEIKGLNRTRENMLDLSPSDKNTLMLAVNFDSSDFVQTDINIGIQIREKEIKLEIARKRYAVLFTGKGAK